MKIKIIYFLYETWLIYRLLSSQIVLKLAVSIIVLRSLYLYKEVPNVKVVIITTSMKVIGLNGWKATFGKEII